MVYLLKQINLNKELLEEIIDICKRHAQIEKVVLFGSRARGDNSPKSDIDLAIYANSNFSDFIEDMENNTRTLLEFDFSNMRTVKDEFFIEQVNKEGVTIYEKC
ncbi:nucleotidyltransferase domain-containing protein [Clostridium intestinale]|uniref:nucleotidyltransferase domain-containing protein n=1 Tax=Clostridium intestinale TaxID=36845 RepID=UPI0028E1C1C1|nr:nucleotidyltransferase domain-containing protein [Clostridium intestinale]